MGLKDAWEWLFHWSNITHIANAYPQDIWVSSYSTDLELKQLDLDIAIKDAQSTGQVNAKLENATNTSWFKVTSGTVHRYERRSKTEKLTIVCENTLDQARAAANQGSPQVLLLNYKIEQNFSFIVTKNAGFLQQKYGSSNLFEDYLGVDHTP